MVALRGGKCLPRSISAMVLRVTPAASASAVFERRRNTRHCQSGLRSLDVMVTPFGTVGPTTIGITGGASSAVTRCAVFPLHFTPARRAVASALAGIIIVVIIRIIRRLHCRSPPWLSDAPIGCLRPVAARIPRHLRSRDRRHDSAAHHQAAASNIHTRLAQARSLAVLGVARA